MAHKAPDGSLTAVDTIVNTNWVLSQEQSAYNRLKIISPGNCYSVIIFRNPVDGSHRVWYMNMEEPVHRTNFNYDYTDLFLDVIIAPGLAEWHWEDEDELEEAVKAGLVSREKASSLYVEGEKAVNWLKSGTSPFNGWENWQPDPAWQIPVLPENWDFIE